MNKITALMVHDEEELFRDLKRRVSELGIPSIQLRTFVEVKYLLKRLHQPTLIFTDVTLPDGTWTDVVEAAKNTTPPCPVIVVSRFVDLSLYLEALQRGTADFIVVPFSTAELEPIVRAATAGLTESQEQARAALERQPVWGAGVASGEDCLTASSPIGPTQAEVKALAASNHSMQERAQEGERIEAWRPLEKNYAENRAHSLSSRFFRLFGKGLRLRFLAGPPL